MKVFFILTSITLCSFAFSQELPTSLSIAAKETKVEILSLEFKTELQSYSKNYNRIFRYDNYTFDVFDYGERKIYIGDINRWNYDNNTPHIFKVMPLAGVNVDAFYANPCNAGYNK